MKTLEGLEIKKLKTFPSMEYGDNGGVSCDLYFRGEFIGSYFDQGNGGCSDIHISDKSSINEKTLKTICYTAIRRLDPKSIEEYGEKIVKSTAIDEVVNYFIASRNRLKYFKRLIKKYTEGSFQLVVFDNGWKETSMLFPLKSTLNDFIETSKTENIAYKKLFTYKSVNDFENI